LPREAGFVEVLIVDDGALPAANVSVLQRLTHQWGARFQYRATRAGRGLFPARITALAEARGEVILFVDDDVELDAAYLAGLVARYREWPQAAGVGGVDELTRPLGVMKRLFTRLFLLDSGDPGRLSASCFSHSMFRWIEQAAPFQSEFLSGCNMSFRLDAVRAVSPPPWLDGYSLAEDIFLSLKARAYGPLWVDPALRVRHHRSSVGRGAGRGVSYLSIVNPYHLLREGGARWTSYAALAWTVAGLVVKDVVRPARWSSLPEYAKGIAVIARSLFTVRPL
jgi:hypothetical protein